MLNKKKLSICIPSYNRAGYLPDLLESIAKQYDERIEVVICDNGSTDETAFVVESWQRSYPWIVYDRMVQNEGPDRCFLRAVQGAQGDFCWLMGDDDIIESGAIALVLSLLREELTGMTVNRLAYDKDLKNRYKEPSRNSSCLFQASVDCFSSIFCLFGFLSAQVIRRSDWLLIVSREDVTPYFNAYVLVYIIGRMIQENPYWLYVDTPCVGWRSGNDSFARALGLYDRFLLDLHGYHAIIGALLKQERRVYRKVLSQIVLEHLVGHIWNMKFHGYKIGRRGFHDTFGLLWSIPCFWGKLLPLFCTPCWFLRALRASKRQAARLIIRGQRAPL